MRKCVSKTGVILILSIVILPLLAFGQRDTLFINEAPLSSAAFPFWGKARTGVTIIGNSQFAKYHVKKLIKETDFECTGTFSLTDSRFYEEVSFFQASFFRFLLIDRDTFQKELNISASTFSDKVSFQKNLYTCRTEFNHNTCLSTISFDNSTYKKTASACNSNFTNDAAFAYNTYDDALNLKGSTFHKHLDFRHSHFSRNLCLANITLNDSAYVDFTQTLLPDTLDFSSIKRIPNIIDLTVAKYSDSQKHYINFYGTDPSNVHFDYKYFKLHFPSFSSLDEKLKVYTLLLKKYEQYGKGESYKLLYADYKQLQHPLTSWLPRIWWNFGFNGERVFLWLALYLIIAAWIVYANSDFFNRNIHIIHLDKKNKTRLNNILAALVYVVTIIPMSYRLLREGQSKSIHVKWYIIIALLILVQSICIYCIVEYLSAISL